jgi:uncharacterized SAM-binding protein YcdF (DUF218 family)
MPHLRRKWIIIIGGGVVIAIVILARVPILLGIGRFLIINDEVQSADLIHVLGGDVDRIDYGVQLYQQGFGRKMFFTGGRIEIPLVDTTYSRLAQQYAIAKGVRSEDVLRRESLATSTYEEALELKAFLDGGAEVKSVIIVSSPYHMRRARWTFTKVLGDRVTFQFAPVPFEMSRHKQQWWTDEWSFNIVLTEYLKIPFYYANYLLIIPSASPGVIPTGAAENGSSVPRRLRESAMCSTPRTRKIGLPTDKKCQLIWHRLEPFIRWQGCSEER